MRHPFLSLSLFTDLIEELIFKGEFVQVGRDQRLQLVVVFRVRPENAASSRSQAPFVKIAGVKVHSAFAEFLTGGL